MPARLPANLRPEFRDNERSLLWDPCRREGRSICRFLVGCDMVLLCSSTVPLLLPRHTARVWIFVGNINFTKLNKLGRGANSIDAHAHWTKS